MKIRRTLNPHAQTRIRKSLQKYLGKGGTDTSTTDGNLGSSHASFQFTCDCQVLGGCLSPFHVKDWQAGVVLRFLFRFRSQRGPALSSLQRRVFKFFPEHVSSFSEAFFAKQNR
eukprot:s1267_g8.t1